jgi:acid stress-induced BolA-like protein IbaG/YrbA
MSPQQLQQKILEAMPDAQVNVQSDDNVHYSARIISPEFEGRSRIERHRLVHAAIGPGLGHEIHALSLDLKAPDEAGN